MSFLAWNDNDPPPEDINAARLRAKYYGCQYIVFRPLIHHLLHPLDGQDRQPRQSVAADGMDVSPTATGPSSQANNPKSELSPGSTTDDGEMPLTNNND